MDSDLIRHRAYSPDLQISPHARERMIDMKVSTDMVREALAEANLRYVGPPKYPQDRMISVHEDLAVITDENYTVVITVLWAGATGRGYDGGPAYGT